MRQRSFRASNLQLLLLIFALGATLPARGQLVFDDGNDHVVDSRNAQIEIRNGSSVTLQACPRGGCATGVLVEGGSRLTVEEDGRVADEGRGPVVVVRDSVLEVNAGFINDEDGDSAVDLQGTSTAILRGGRTGPLRLADRSEAQIVGEVRISGNGLALTADGSSHVIQNGGTLYSDDRRDDCITGHIATLNDDSRFELIGGQAESNFTQCTGSGAQGFHVNDDARLTVSGGNISVTGGGASDPPMGVISLRDNATASLRGVSIISKVMDYPLLIASTLLELSGSATAGIAEVDVTISGGVHNGAIDSGTLTMFSANEQAAVIVSSGQFTMSTSEVSEATILLAAGESHITVDGGLYGLSIWAEDLPPESPPMLFRIAHASESARIEIRGGTFSIEDPPDRGPPGKVTTRHLEAVDNATITLYGNNFNYPRGPISELTGTLTGELADGSPLEWSFSRAMTATIMLVSDPHGDFNTNGIFDSEDIDLLDAVIRRGTNDPEFDLVEDGIVDEVDRNFWVHSLSNTYFGDTDLDGEFNSADLVTVFQAGHYEDGLELNSGWAQGDWNGNGDFESGDLIVAFQDGGYEAGPRAAALAEPTSLGATLVGLIGLALVSNCRRRAG